MRGDRIQPGQVVDPASEVGESQTAFVEYIGEAAQVFETDMTDNDDFGHAGLHWQTARRFGGLGHPCSCQPFTLRFRRGERA